MRFPCHLLTPSAYVPQRTTRFGFCGETEKPKREPIANNQAFCRAASLAADAMRLALSPPPFGSADIADQRLAVALSLRADALNLR